MNDSQTTEKFIKTQPITSAILSGILLEAVCHPSPGLVSPFSSGSHQDMNVYSFMVSTAAISLFFDACVRLGSDWDRKQDLLAELRLLGVSAEKEMRLATGGVNTHKGIIFLGGVASAAAGIVLRETGTLKAESICAAIAAICDGLVEKDLKSGAPEPGKALTQGECWYKKIKTTGVRGEAEKGLPSVRMKGLPVFHRTIQTGSLQDAMVQTLLHLMMVTEDTTVLARAGEKGLAFVKETAMRTLELGGIETEKGRHSIEEMEREFISRRISPGGSADLLAITLALWIMENGPLPLSRILQEKRGQDPFDAV